MLGNSPCLPSGSSWRLRHFDQIECEQTLLCKATSESTGQTLAMPLPHRYRGGVQGGRMMPVYDVPIVRQDLLSLWHEFWDGPEPTERASLASVNGDLDRAVKIRAANASQAASLAERDHPGDVAIRDYVRKLRQ
jgi:hypothetical protein